MPRRDRKPRAVKPVNLDVQIAIVPRGMLAPRAGLTLLVTEEAAAELKLSNGERRNAREYWSVHQSFGDARKNGAIVLMRDVDASN